MGDHRDAATLFRLVFIRFPCRSWDDVVLPLEFKLDLYAMATAGVTYLSAYPVRSCGLFTTLWVQ